ncbi:phosphatidate cytidylyltransferase [Mycoplasmoides pirum]|uniref:phosphatidate cytidylyltransferase n=1 Tax=Mycoplasmoides pirum TaxID=2122 RepID=UPI0006987042|nr:phosphatidate cytidylyltransferase [Mycoplasmoides pirum]
MKINKKPQSRLLVSLYLIIYLILLLTFSALSDSFNSWSPWSPTLVEPKAYDLITSDHFTTTILTFKDTYENAATRFAMAFISVTLIAMLGYFFSKELNKLIFKNNKGSFYSILGSFVFSFYLISMIYIVPLYFFNSQIDPNQPELSMDVGRNINLDFWFGNIRVYDGQSFALFGLIITSICVFFMLLIIDFVLLFVYKIINRKNIFALLFIHLITIFGMITVSYILIVRGWTTLLLIGAIASLTDVFAYLFGKKFGHKQLVATISPNKTWTGAICGILFASLSIILIILLYAIPSFKAILVDNPSAYEMAPQKYDPHNLITNLFVVTFSLTGATFKVYWWATTIMFIIFLSIISIIGDLSFSFIKRKYQIKDYGDFLGKHGGFLDRFDSMALIFFTYMLYLLFVFIISGRSMLAPNTYATNFGANSIVVGL